MSVLVSCPSWNPVPPGVLSLLALPLLSPHSRCWMLCRAPTPPLLTAELAEPSWPRSSIPEPRPLCPLGGQKCPLPLPSLLPSLTLHTPEHRLGSTARTSPAALCITPPRIPAFLPNRQLRHSNNTFAKPVLQELESPIHQTPRQSILLQYFGKF